MRRFYYKMRQVLLNASFITKQGIIPLMECDSIQLVHSCAFQNKKSKSCSYGFKKENYTTMDVFLRGFRYFQKISPRLLTSDESIVKSAIMSCFIKKNQQNTNINGE